MSDNVREIQAKLAALGYPVGEIDGVIGEKTKAAVRMFQTVKGMDVDGIPGTQTRKALGLDASPAVVVAGDPPWLTIARGYLGMREIVGPKHEAKVVSLWKKAQVPGVNDDETPWCAAYVSAVLEEAGIVSKRTGWARGYLKWGQKLGAAAVGAIVVFERGPNAGHVGFVVGRDARGNLMVLGGNQGNAVTIASFPKSRVLGYRWPPGVEPTGNFSLPVLHSGGGVSRNEA
jgi:uncharacterized protein (TIGR02594 family)